MYINPVSDKILYIGYAFQHKNSVTFRINEIFQKFSSDVELLYKLIYFFLNKK